MKIQTTVNDNEKIPVVVHLQGSPDGTPPPDDLLANLDHVLRLQAKLSTLEAALRSAVDAMAESARRWSNPNIDDVVAVRRALTDAEVKGRRRVSSALPNESVARYSYGKCPFAVYVLLDHGRAVYVGRSTNWRARLRSHWNSGKVFDSAEVYECSSHAEMVDLEAVLQQQHRPTLNLRIERRGVA